MVLSVFEKGILFAFCFWELPLLSAAKESLNQPITDGLRTFSQQLHSFFASTYPSPLAGWVVKSLIEISNRHAFMIDTLISRSRYLVFFIVIILNGITKSPFKNYFKALRHLTEIFKLNYWLSRADFFPIGAHPLFRQQRYTNE